MLRRGRDVRYVAGGGFTEPGDVAAAARLAADADVAVVVIGEDAYAEGVGDIADLTLPEAQLRLVEAVQATGTPTVLVLVEGRPRVIRRVADGARGVVMAYWPGMHGGEAVADVLFGEINPSGRLPFTYPRDPNELLTYDHKLTETLSPRFDGRRIPAAVAVRPRAQLHDVRVRRPAPGRGADGHRGPHDGAGDGGEHGRQGGGRRRCCSTRASTSRR